MLKGQGHNMLKGQGHSALKGQFCSLHRDQDQGHMVFRGQGHSERSWLQYAQRFKSHYNTEVIELSKVKVNI